MLLSEITWLKAEEYFKGSDVVIIPVGSIECHGKHLPLGTDTLIPEKIIELVRKRDDRFLIAPPVPYGACESLQSFPGTIDLGNGLFYDLMKRIIENLKSHGARKFVILNGHGGNVKALEKIGYELDSCGCMMAILNWWLNVWEINEKWKGGHGGAQETAAVMAVNPELIDKKYIGLPLEIRDLSENIKGAGFNTVQFRNITLTVPRMIRHITDNGWIGPDHPENATKEWGDEMLNSYADFMVSFLNEFEKVEL